MSLCSQNWPAFSSSDVSLQGISGVMTQSTTIPHSDKTQLPNSQQVQHVLDRAAWEARVFTSLLQLQCMSTACGLSQNYPAEQEFVVTLHAFAPRGFEGCTELSALSKCLTRSGKKKERKKSCSWVRSGSKSTTKPSPHITLSLSWIQCVCGWVYEEESVRSAYCVRENSQPAQDLRALFVPSMPNQRTHLAQPSR